MAHTTRSKTDKELVKPRANARDSFEQNPLSHVAQRMPHRHTPEEDQALMQEAVRLVVEEGANANVVAKEFGIAPSSIYQWRLKYDDFLRADWETNSAAGSDTAFLPEAQRLRFAENWARLLEKSHATTRDFRQDPLEVFLQTSPYTGWLYSAEGRLERSTLIGAIVAVVGAVAVLLFLMTDKMPDSGAFDPSAMEVPDPKPRHDLDVKRGAAVVQEFLRTDGWPRKLNYIHQAAEVHDLVRDFFVRFGDKPITDGELKMGMVGDDIVSVSIDVPSRNQNLYFNLIPSGASYKIDWKTSSLYQAENIEEFLRTQSTKPVELFVQLARGTYYNHYWADSEKYECYELTFPGLERRLYGYAAKDSAVGTQLRILTGIEEKHAAVVEARFPETPKDPRQVEVVRVVREEWLIRDDAAESLQSAEIK